jgi:hypothetical protein
MTASQIKAQIEAQLKAQSGSSRLMVHAKGEGSMGGAAGVHIGTVDQIENGNYIKLTPDAANDEPCWIPLDWVESVDSKAVYLYKTAAEVKAELTDESPQTIATKKVEAERDPISGAGIG